MNIYQLLYETMDRPIDEVVSLAGVPRPEPLERKRQLIMLYLGIYEEWDLENFTSFAVAQIEAGWYEQVTIHECGEWNPVPVLPSKLTMAKNAIVAGVKAAATFFSTVSQEEQERRHNICTVPCEFYIAASDRCAKCGCFTTYKAKLEAWHCPIKKW